MVAQLPVGERRMFLLVARLFVVSAFMRFFSAFGRSNPMNRVTTNLLSPCQSANSIAMLHEIGHFLPRRPTNLGGYHRANNFDTTYRNGVGCGPAERGLLTEP
jgi:hypothetical protein